MKLVTGMVASLVIGTLSFGAFRRERDPKEDVAKMNLTKVGSITTSRTTSPMDARRDLSKKADELGGKYFVVIAGQKNEKPYTRTLTFINNPVIRKRACWPVFIAVLLVLPRCATWPDSFHRSAHHSCRHAAFPSGQLLQLPERQPSLVSLIRTTLPMASIRSSMASISG